MTLWLGLLLHACRPTSSVYLPVDHAPPVHDTAMPVVAPPPPSSGKRGPVLGGTLHTASDGTVVAADSENGLVWMIDPESLEIEATFDLGRDAEPFRIDDDGMFAWVSLRGRGAVARLPLPSTKPRPGTRAQVTEVCPEPRGVDVDGTEVWIACATGELITLDAATGATLQSTTLDPDLRDVVVQDDVVYASRFRAADVLVFDRTGTLEARLRPPTVEHFGPSGRLSHFEPSVAWRMRGLKDGAVVLSHQRALIGVVAESPQGYYGQMDGPCTGLVHSAYSRLRFDGEESTIWTSIPVAEALPVDVLETPEGNLRFAFALGETGAASRVIRNPWVHEMGRFEYFSCHWPERGEGPKEVAVAIALASGKSVRLHRGPTRLQVEHAWIDLVDPAYARGFQLFHSDVGLGVTCASCHPEGQDDGRAWSLSNGVRRTQNIAGGMTDAGPYHWNGGFATMESLLQDVMVRRMAAGNFQLRTLDAERMLGFLDGTRPLRGLVRDPKQVEEGATLFWSEDVGCGSCHNGPAYTNETTVDVGTGRAWQVPTLLGIAHRENFMHDGCAPTLRDRFGPCGGGDRHGATSHLSDHQIDALVAYLETL